MDFPSLATATLAAVPLGKVLAIRPARCNAAGPDFLGQTGLCIFETDNSIDRNGALME
jgi:hypothetical protein